MKKQYTSPETDITVIEPGESVILTSGFTMWATWEDAAGNQYTTQGVRTD